MSKFFKRALILFLVLASCISFVPAISFTSSAGEVSYTYDGKYIYNWGVRGDEAEFLSPNAEKFYEKNGSYDELSSYIGGTGKSDVPNSSLYRELKDLMVSAQTYTTSYGATRDLFKYTDCQSGGGKISSFYSGNQIGPSWGDGWNREHTWPNSKGLGGQDEDDIMMLRPTSTSENSSRGNTAYGESSGYYNPNSESGGKYDLRGDVARIFLYVYVRWGNKNYAWGKSGVMESPEVMLKWMEEDPVDTWELGRNDSVESITGTRNVFVDYPELAFLLFGEEIPDDMTTPSGEGNGDCGHNNFNTGVVFVATCTEKGYTLYTCKTADCGYSYKANVTAAKGHSYSSGACIRCGAEEPIEPAKPMYATEITVGKAYKLGFFSDAKGAEYYFNGTMKGYYGATDTSYANGVDVFAETSGSGYRLYFNNASGKKQYINLILSNGHYNFTFADTASSVFTWDTAKHAFFTTVSGEVCYMGTFGTYDTVSVLRSSMAKDTDYIARMYTFGEGTSGGSGDSGEIPDGTCRHDYSAAVTAPTCTKGGFTTYTCSLCSHSYESDELGALGHNYVSNVCTVCGATKGASSKATLSFTDDSNRTECTATQQIWVQNGITLTNNKASSQNDVANYSNPARFYKGSSVTIECNGMTKIEINCTGLETKYVSGWLNAPTGATATNNNGIITVVFDAPVDSVVYTNLSAQCRAYDITVYAESETPPACEHANTTVTGAVAPGCTTDGHTGKTSCLDCGEVISLGQVIGKTNHNWTAADCDTPKTCSVCKTTEGTALGHNWLDATETNPKTCDRCGITEGDKLPQAPGGTDAPDGPTDGGETPDDGAPTDKDHSLCEGSFFEEIWNKICNFFIRLFGGKEKCVCGEYYN